MPQEASDGSIAFSGGQHDGLLPDRIAPDQFRRGINITTEGGGISPRPGFVHQDITVVTEGGIEDRSYAQIFRNGKFQSIAAYDTDDGQFAVVVISGIIFRIDPRNNEAEVIPLGNSGEDRMDQYRRRIPWSYGGRFLVFFDWPDVPVVIEGREARRVNVDAEIPEIPTSVLGAYVNKRLFVSNAVHEFGGSDPVAFGFPDAPVTFEESLSPASAFNGQFFSLGSQSANQPITAMGFLQVPDTSTGVGPLIVATKNSIYTHRVDEPRISWEQIAFSRLVMFNAGISGPRAFSNLNTDLIFLSGDNQVRSLLLGASEQQRWMNTPISREVKPFLEEHDNPDLLDLAFVSSYKNRVFVSVAPFVSRALDLQNREVFDYAHGGMVVLELDNVSALGGAAAPAWAGLWTGLNPMDMITLDDGPYIMSKDPGGTNRIYRMDESITYDVFEGEEVDITSRLYTREYDFGARFLDKELKSVDYTFSEIEGSFEMKAEYAASHFKNWNLWKSFEHEAPAQDCEGPCECNEEMQELTAHCFRDLDFGDPEEKDCDPLTDDMATIFRQVGLRLTIRGRKWRLEDIRLSGEIQEDERRLSETACSEASGKRVFRDCEPSDWELHRIGPSDDKDQVWESQIETC